jgi:hypothetical protein
MARHRAVPGFEYAGQHRQEESAMLDNIAPGTTVQVKVIQKPTSLAASKTIVRLFSKDPGVKRENQRLRKARKEHFSQNRRGGRFWDVNVVKQRPVAADLGVTKTIVATLDVLKDLNSVSRFVEVTKAG